LDYYGLEIEMDLEGSSCNTQRISVLREKREIAANEQMLASGSGIEAGASKILRTFNPFTATLVGKVTERKRSFGRSRHRRRDNIKGVGI
jgi:hypothetical protein